MDLVLFGIQGSGKGTLGKFLAQEYGLEVFETGSELRKLSSENSALGQKVKSIVEAGHLVPNEVVMDIIENFMAHLPAGKNVLFDGIPRKMEQAQTFEALMKKLGRDFMGLFLEISEELAMKRLTTRRICKVCKTVYPAVYTKTTCEKCGGELGTRSDDNPESIKTRLKAYFDETLPVIEHYKKEQKMITINGEQSIEEVNQAANQVLEKILA